jgi:hypothetical protein
VDHIDFYHSLAELAATWVFPEDEEDPAPDYQWFLHELHARVFTDNVAKLQDEYILENHERWEQDQTFLDWAFDKFGGEAEYEAFLGKVRGRKNRRFLTMAVKAFMPFVVGSRIDANGIYHSITDKMKAAEAAARAAAGNSAASDGVLADVLGAVGGKVVDDAPDFTLPLGGRAWTHSKASRWTKTAQFSTLKSFFTKLAGTLGGDCPPPDDDGPKKPKVTVSVEVVRARRLPVMDWKAGNSDPFVSLSVQEAASGGSEGRTSKTKRTHVVSDSCDPEWNEKFEFQVADSSSGVVTLVVKDKDVSGSQVMGEVQIDLASLVDPANNRRTTRVRKWHKLGAPGGSKKKPMTPVGAGVTMVTAVIKDPDGSDGSGGSGGSDGSDGSDGRGGFGELEIIIRRLVDGKEVEDEAGKDEVATKEEEERQALLAVMASCGSEEERKALLAAMAACGSEEERTALLAALASCRSEEERKALVASMEDTFAVLPPLKEDLTAKRMRNKQLRGQRRVTVRKRQAERKKQRVQQAARKQYDKHAYPEQDWRFHQWGGKQDTELEERGRGFSGKRVGEGADGAEEGTGVRHRLWSGRLGDTLGGDKLGMRGSSAKSTSSSRPLTGRSTVEDNISGSRRGSGLISLSLSGLDTAPGAGGTAAGRNPSSIMYQQQRRRQQLLRAEHEFDPTLLNLTRPTVASIVQRAPILPASRDVLERRAGTGRPIPSFKSDCAVTDTGLDPYGVFGTKNVAGFNKRAPPRYMPGDPRVANSLTFDAHGWSEAREFLAQLAR